MKSIKMAGLLLGMAILFWGCQKKGNFINESKVGSGIHYYPLILNQQYTDTITHKRFSDTTFSSGQKIIFEIKYFSQDSLDQIELWVAGSGQKKKQKVWSAPYKSSYYSPTQKCDTTFATCTLPPLKDTTRDGWTLYPTVITQQGLAGNSYVTILKK